MKEVRIITIDQRGRIVIPNIIRKSLGLSENAQLMLIADSELKEMKIIPVGLSEDLNRFKITMKDTPGSLAKIASIFGEKGVSMMYCDAVIIEKGKTAILTVIFENRNNVNLEELKQVLVVKGGALDIQTELF